MSPFVLLKLHHFFAIITKIVLKVGIIMLFSAVLAIGIVSAIFFMKERVKKCGIKALLLKTVTSIIFIFCGAIGSANALKHGYCVFPILVLMGLVFGLLGDIWLDLKWIYKDDNDIYTFSGFFSFIVGHILFIAAILHRFADWNKIIYIILPVIISLIAAVGMLILEKPLKMKYGKFKAITVVYTFIVALLAFLSGSFALMNGFKIMTLNLMFAGGIFFALSDLILSGTYFGENKKRPIDIITNHTTYYAAQFLIASSLMFLK